MKKPWFIWLVIPVLLCGCSSTKFTDYHGADVFHGKGGAVRDVDGTDFWYDGEPDRTYKIIGFIEESPGKRMPLGRLAGVFSGSGDNEPSIASLAHKRGGDGVIIVGGGVPEQDSEDDDDRRFGRKSRQKSKYVVIKYVDSPGPN
jgi:hypothetical protein